mmetsp:Transcript_81540/g.214070  ORF Transcript_81540/g.214070 Transcript_81540/m.214070 type:complete len:433 (+) Transcript_81540:80-1378(+)
MAASGEPPQAEVEVKDVEPRSAIWLARYAKAEDLPPEAVGDAELAKAEELREKVLATLKSAGSDAPPTDWKAHFFTRASLVRFLRGRNGKVDDAVVMMADALKWFETWGWWENCIKQFEESDEPEKRKLVIKYSPNGAFGVDRRGAPVLYFRTGLQDTSGIVREVGNEVFIRSMCWGLERDAEKLHEASLKVGEALIGQVNVLDCAGSTFTKSGATATALTWFTDNVLKDHFPESAKVILVVNTPWFFSIGWKLIAPFVPAATKEKMKICSGDYMKTLLEYVDIEQVPAFLGGKSTEPWLYGEGGDVPDSTGGAGSGLKDSLKDLKVSKQETVEAEVLPGATCIYEYRVKAFDIGVSVTVDGKELVAPGKLTAEAGCVCGRYTAPKGKAAKLVIDFDNSHSWMRAKDVQYNFTAVDIPEGALDDAADAKTGA